MNKTLRIRSFHSEKTDKGCNVVFGLTIGENSYDLHYDILGKGIEMVPERCDSVVLMFLLFAIKKGYDIQSDYPISRKLYYNMTKHIIPQLYVCNKNARKIKLTMPLTEDVYCGTWRGTGVSLGVDSFTTIHEYTDDCIFDEYKLTHLVHLKTGSHCVYRNIDQYDGKTEIELFNKEHELVEEYCNKNNFELITIETNLHQIMCSEGEYKFSPFCTVRNLGAIMLLQSYFDKYYYASSYNLDQFMTDLNVDSSHYEKWMIPLLATENITFYSSNEEMSRSEKVEYISKFPDTYDSLHVCWLSGNNCGKCAKCVRTITQLDLLGVLDKYEECFNLEEYKSHRKQYFNQVVARKNVDPFCKEIYLYMRQKQMKTPNFLAVMLTMLKLFINRTKRNIKK